MRSLCVLIFLVLFICALAAANRQKPLLVQARVHQADYPVCVRVVPPPLVPPRTDVFHPNTNTEII
jgi:hypothetical protein